MDDPSGVRGARTSLAIAFTIFTALVALLWVLPKSPGGGFWLFTLPAALLFPYFTYRVIAPRSAERTSKDSVVMIAALVVLYLGGVVVRSLALPEANLTGAAATMESLTETWRTYSLWTLLVVGVLTLVERSKTGSSAPKATSASEPVVAASGEAVPAKLPTSGRGPVEVTRPSPLVPAQPAPQPAAIRPTTTSRPATVPAPAFLARPAWARSPQVGMPASAPVQPPAPAPRPVERTATVSGASFADLTTLAEVAASLSDPSSATSLQLSATPAGLELAAAGTEIDTVAGTWNGAEPLRVPTRLSRRSRPSLHRRSHSASGSASAMRRPSRCATTGAFDTSHSPRCLNELAPAAACSRLSGPARTPGARRRPPRERHQRDAHHPVDPFCPVHPGDGGGSGALGVAQIR